MFLNHGKTQRNSTTGTSAFCECLGELVGFFTGCVVVNTACESTHYKAQ